MPDRSVSYVFKGNFTNLTAGLTAAGRNVTELGTKMTALDKNGARMRAGLTQVGDVAGKVGLVAAAGLGAVVLTAARFDKAMSSVQAATHETAANMDLLRDAAIKAGADTAYSASEAAGAIEELAKAGVSTQDILDGGLSGALNLAAAGAIEVTDAAETAATAMTQFGLAGDQVNHVADLLAAGAGKAQGGVGDLSMALKQSGLVAAQTGLSVEETVGALAEFASAGLIGSDAGTSFKTMLQSLNPNSEKAATLMAELGISAYDAQGNFVGMENLAGQLKESLSKLSVEQQNAALKTIFGSDAVRAAAIIFKDGAEGVAEWQNKVNDAGYAAETAAQRMDNLAGDWEQFTGSLETALIGAGEGSQGPLRSIVQGATEVVNGLSAIPGPAKTAGTALAGVVALGGGGIYFGAKIVDGIANVTDALGKLGIEAGTARSKVAAIGTAGAAATIGLGTFLDTMGQLDSWQRSSEAADATVKSFQDLTDALSYSNVGKYADDLHINLGRLTQDLIDNGEQGEYVQRVLEQLGNDSHGFGAYMSSLGGNILPFYTAGADKAYDANKDLKSIIDKMPDSLADASSGAESGAEANEDYGTAAAAAARETEKQAAALKKAREAARGQADAFLGLGDSLNNSKVSLSGWLDELQKQADALRNFRKNAQDAAEKGLREGLIKALQKAGPEGAMRMKQLADGTEAEIGRANRAWSSLRREKQRYVDFKVSPEKVDIDTGAAERKHARLMSRLIELDRYKARPHVDADDQAALRAFTGIDQRLAEIDRLTAWPSVNVDTSAAMGKLASLRAAIGSLNVPSSIAAPRAKRATGGPIYGPGTKTSDSVPIMASRGEFVMSAAAVDHYGLGTMFAMNARRLAGGGSTDGKKDPGKTAAGKASWHLGDDFTMPKSLGATVAALVEVRKELKSLQTGVRASEKTIKRETAERDRLSKVVDKNQAEMDRLTGLYNDLSSTIQQGLAANQFASVTGLGADPWRSSIASSGGERPPTFDEIMASLGASTANAKAFQTATAALTANGLSGAALQSVLEQGLGTAQMFAGLSPKQLAQYQSAYGLNQSALSAAGAAGGQAVYGQDMAKANQILAASQAELARQTAELKAANSMLASMERRAQRAEKQRDLIADHLKDLKADQKHHRKEEKKGVRSQR